MGYRSGMVRICPEIRWDVILDVCSVYTYASKTTNLIWDLALSKVGAHSFQMTISMGRQESIRIGLPDLQTNTHFRQISEYPWYYESFWQFLDCLIHSKLGSTFNSPALKAAKNGETSCTSWFNLPTWLVQLDSLFLLVSRNDAYPQNTKKYSGKWFTCKR